MPVLAAQFSFDKHVRSGLLETVEMMGYAFDEFKPWSWLLKTGKHFNHPMSIAVRSSRENFDWTLQHTYALAEEFEFRFGKKHRCLEHINWIANNLPLHNLPDTNMTEFPRCFGDYKNQIEISNDVVRDYRAYYQIGKRHLFGYTRRAAPEWYH